MSSRSERAWSVWLDWCRATGHDPNKPEDEPLARFSSAVPGTAVDLVLVEARRRSLLPSSPPADPWMDAERDWVSLAESLSRCPAYGWPQGVPGRRDAWLVVLTRGLRFSRGHAVTLRAGRAGPVLERLALMGDDPAVCWGCVAARWVEVVSLNASWSRSVVREEIWRVRATHGVRPPGHGSALACDGTCARVLEAAGSLPPHTLLAPAIDRHGWWNEWRPLSTRAVTAILARRCHRYGPTPDDVEPPIEDLETVRPAATLTPEKVKEVLDSADEVNARIAVLLASFDAH